MAASKGTQQFTPLPGQIQQRRQGEQPPYVHPAVATSPEALAYGLGAQQRTQRASPFIKYNEGRPVDPVQMPPLEQPHREGMTMAEQAGMYGATPEQRVAAQTVKEGSIVEGPRRSFGLGSMDASKEAAGFTPQQMGLMMQDVLPPEAKNDPEYRQGQGADIAVNQPQLALKYGVIRGQQRIPAQALQANIGGGPAGSGRRTVNDTIRDMSRLSAAPPTMPKSDEEAEQQVMDSAAGQSQNVSGGQLTDEERAKVEHAIAKMDDFDFYALRQQMERDNLNNPEQRGIIEARLAPLDLGELIMHDRVRQEITVIPEKFWFTFQSMSGEEDMGVKRLAMQESAKLEVTDRYLLEKYAAMSLACGLVSICGRPIPHSHLDADGNFNPEQFWLKFAWVLKRPLHALSSMGINHTWFELRVRKLFVADKVKNG